MPSRVEAEPELGRGHLDVLRNEPDGRLLVGGWFLPLEHRALEAIDVHVDGVPLALEECLLPAESPDIAAAFPTTPGAERARFFARVRVPAHAGRDRWVRVVPRLAGGRRGLSVHAVLDSSLGAPSPAEVALIGGGYLERALEFLGFFVDLCGLGREAHVLDIGCGIGRMAYGLAAYLRGAGRYLGFDVMGEAIAAAKRDVESRVPRFQFLHVDVANSMYSSAGTASAEAFRFPVESGWADLAIMVSVITHLQPGPTRRYLAETARALAPSGRALVTTFVLDAEAQALVAAGRSAQPFARTEGGWWTVDPALPEKAIGFAPQDLMSWIAETGLAVVARHPGTWCGRKDALSYQDVLLLRPR